MYNLNSPEKNRKVSTILWDSYQKETKACFQEAGWYYRDRNGSKKLYANGYDRLPLKQIWLFTFSA